MLGLPIVWSWGLEEGIKRWVLVPEEDKAGEAGRGPPSAYLYSLGSDNVSRMVAHQLNSSQALILDLEVKDLALAKSSEDILGSQSPFGFLMSTFWAQIPWYSMRSFSQWLWAILPISAPSKVLSALVFKPPTFLRVSWISG